MATTTGGICCKWDASFCERTETEACTLNVQVKCGQGRVVATQGLLVSWGAFKQTVEREEVPEFFRVRLWDRSDVMAALFEHYDALDAEVRAQLPLKRVWVPVAGDSE